MGKESKTKASRRGKKSSGFSVSGIIDQFVKKEKREAILYVRLTAANKKFVEDTAEKYGLSLGTVINNMLEKLRENGNISKYK
jgi:hypothetical protein